MRDAGGQKAGEQAGEKAGGARLWLRVLLPLGASLLGLVTLRLLGPDVVSQKQLSEWIRPLGAWAPLAFVLFLAVRPVTLLPGQLFTAVGGILFGTLMGSVYALLGSLLASVLVYWLARRHGTRFMRRMAGHRYDALRRTARRHDFVFGLISCINPLVPTDVMVALAAATGARQWPTVLGVLLGTVPGTILTAWFGSALSQGQGLTTAVSAAGLVLSLVLGVWVGRRAYREVMDEGEPSEPGASGPGGTPSSPPPSRPRRGPSRLVTPASAVQAFSGTGQASSSP